MTINMTKITGLVLMFTTLFIALAGQPVFSDSFIDGATADRLEQFTFGNTSSVSMDKSNTEAGGDSFVNTDVINTMTHHVARSAVNVLETKNTDVSIEGFTMKTLQDFRFLNKANVTIKLVP